MGQAGFITCVQSPRHDGEAQHQEVVARAVQELGVGFERRHLAEPGELACEERVHRGEGFGNGAAKGGGEPTAAAAL